MTKTRGAISWLSAKTDPFYERHLKRARNIPIRLGTCWKPGAFDSSLLVELIQTLAFKRCPDLNVGCWISRDDLLIIGRLLLVGEFKRVLHGVGLPRESCGLNFGICLKNAVRGPQSDCGLLWLANNLWPKQSPTWKGSYIAFNPAKIYSQSFCLLYFFPKSFLIV